MLWQTKSRIVNILVVVAIKLMIMLKCEIQSKQVLYTLLCKQINTQSGPNESQNISHKKFRMNQPIFVQLGTHFHAYSPQKSIAFLIQPKNKG